MQLQVSSIEELDSDINVHNLKRLSKRVVDEILNTQKKNLGHLWKIGEEDVTTVWKLYEDVIDEISQCPIELLPLFATLARSVRNGEIELEEK